MKDYIKWLLKCTPCSKVTHEKRRPEKEEKLKMMKKDLFVIHAKLSPTVTKLKTASNPAKKPKLVQEKTSLPVELKLKENSINLTGLTHHSTTGSGLQLNFSSHA